MMAVIGWAALATAIAAAVRGTWSPCGLSMLSTITPLGERGRGNRYASTARRYVIGAVAGGALLGTGAAVLAAAVERLDLSSTSAAVIGVVAALVSVASDARLGGFELPIHRRQVNERWLDDFRSWVYGAGFGFQVGSGLSTYITTGATYLMVVLLALAGSPALAFVTGALFGLTRGLAVLLTRRVRSAPDLVAVHESVQRWGQPALAAVVGVQTVAAAAMTGAALGLVPAAVVAVGGAVAWLTGRSRTRPACALDALRDPRVATH
jgi:hypothetical protein